MARFVGDLYVEGKPYPHCPRLNLKRLLKEAAEKSGLFLNVGLEPEHFLVTRKPDGSIEPWDPANIDQLPKPCYDFKGISSAFGYLQEIVSYCNQLGWGAYQADHEDANGQYEVNFQYADALTTADRYTFFKMMTSQVAPKYGAVATHMAKPFADRTGSGAHMHYHVADRTGNNLFEDHEDNRGMGLSKLAYQFLGGVLKHAPALCAILSVPVLLLSVYSLVLLTIGTGTITRLVRWLCDVNRRFAARSGVQVETPYRPEPEVRANVVGWRSRSRWILADPATWRDLSWLLFNTVVGLIGLIPAAGLYYVLEGLVMAGGLWRTVLRAEGHGRWYLYVRVDSPETALIAAVLAIALFLVWVLASPPILKTHAYFARSLLGPTRRAALASRVRHLAETRSDALEAQAAELRRIERDLHDGTQQRLVSLALDVRAAEASAPPELVELKAQLSRTADGLAGAVENLQEISRGIHPAILSQGGLGPALKTLARRSSVPVQLDVSVDRRLPENVEVAVYYVVSEALTNVAKHAHASMVRVDLEADEAVVRLSVGDDGVGGATCAQGSGLIGLRDRIEALGGRIEIASPSGKGTTLIVEMPVTQP